MTAQTWTKELVQQHAQVAVAIEIYTLPFYFTAMTSIKDTDSEAYKTINSVCIEEMLHLQLAANLCIALDTTPNITVPKYGVNLPYLKPDDPATNHYALLNATLGAFNETTLNTMLDIETPEEFESQDHTTPQYPYDSIGNFYEALLAGIQAVGVDQFSWNTTNQQDTWHGQVSGLTAIIANIDDATSAINTINEQGEGQNLNPVPTPPFTGKQFPIESQYQLQNDSTDSSAYNTTSHFGRFINLQNAANSGGYPPTYSVTTPPGSGAGSAQDQLQTTFAAVVSNLNDVWTNGADIDFTSMMALATDATAVWQAGAIPNWG